MWLIVRHGTTVANEENKFSGQTDVPLTEKGLEETHKAVESILERLKGYSASEVMIFSSPLQRARILAEEIGKRTSWSLKMIDDLREIHLGGFEGLAIEEIEDRYPVEYRQWMNEYKSFTFPGGESYLDFEKRVKRALERINKEAELQEVKPGVKIVVSHGGVSQVLIKELDRHHPSSEMLKNAEIREIKE